MKNGIIGEEEEAMIVAGAERRSPSDMRNEMPRFLKKIMAGDTRIRGMLIITSDVILQGIKQGVYTVQRVTNSNAYLEIEGTNLMLLKIQWKHGGDLYKIVDTDMIDNLALYGWHYARGEKEPYSCIKKNKKLILISVKRSLEYRKDLKKFVENPPKSKAGNRIIPMTEESERILQEVYKKRDEIPVVTEYADYVFRNQDGKPAHRGSYNKVLRRVAKEMGIEAFSMHCLRHTFATRAIEAGINPKSLQKILGHSTLSLTMDLYVHVTDDTLFSEMKKFESKRADAETEEHQEEDQKTEE